MKDTIKNTTKNVNLLPGLNKAGLMATDLDKLLKPELVDEYVKYLDLIKATSKKGVR